MQILRSDASGAMLLAVSADSRYLAASDGRSVSVWELDGLDGKPFVTHPIGTFDCQFLGNRLVFRVPPHSLLTLDLSSGQLSDFVSVGIENVFAISPSGEVVLARDPGGGFSCWRVGVTGLKLPPRKVWSNPREPHNWRKSTLFPADAQTVCVTTAFSHVLSSEVHSTTEKRNAVSLDLSISHSTPWLFTSDGLTLLSFDQNRIHSHDAQAGGGCRLLVQYPSPRWFRTISAHPSNAILAGLTTDDAVSFYDLASGGLLRTYAWKLGKLTDLVFTPDGTRCAVTGSRGRVLVFDIE